MLTRKEPRAVGVVGGAAQLYVTLHQGFGSSDKVPSRYLMGNGVGIWEKAFRRQPAARDEPAHERCARLLGYELCEHPRSTVWPRLDRAGRASGNLSAGLHDNSSKLSTAAAAGEKTARGGLWTLIRA